MRITDQDALIVVDVQNDFCPGGALPVPGGDGVVPVINRIMGKFEHQVFSRDWHPSDHCSFADSPTFEDQSWPAHCVQNSPGAEFHGDLHVPLDAVIIDKGDDPDTEAYSAFQGTTLTEHLHRRGITRVFVAGLATDYCVRATAEDAKREGFEVIVIEDGCRGIRDDSSEAALAELQKAGVERWHSGILFA